MVDKIIKFICDSSLQKWPKKMQNIIFVLYWPKRIKLWPGEFKHETVCLFEQIIATYVLLPTICKNGLCMESFQ